MALTPEHPEDLTFTLPNAGPGQGAIEFAWGSRIATARYTVK